MSILLAWSECSNEKSFAWFSLNTFSMYGFSLALELAASFLYVKLI
jgi:hypothetical protein